MITGRAQAWACALALALTGSLGCQIVASPIVTSPGTADDTAAISAERERALAVLRRMSAFVASRSALSFDAEVHYDAVQASGQKLEFGSRRSVLLERPDRARVEVIHRDGQRELLIFDGERLSMAAPTLRVFATTEFRGTTAEAFEHLTATRGLAMPLTDLLRGDLPDDIARRATDARHLGFVTVSGVRCEHLAFRTEHVDFQLFVAEGDEAFPVRLLVDYRDDPGAPQFRAQFSRVDSDPALTDDLFRYRPAPGFQRVDFAELLDLVLGPLEPEPQEVRR